MIDAKQGWQCLQNESHHLFKSVTELEGKPKKSLSAVKDFNGEKQFNGDRVLTLCGKQRRN